MIWHLPFFRSRARQHAETVRLLTAAKAWINVLANTLDIEPEDTSIKVKAVGGENGERVVAEITLAQTLREIDAALEAAK